MREMALKVLIYLYTQNGWRTEPQIYGGIARASVRPEQMVSEVKWPNENLLNNAIREQVYAGNIIGRNSGWPAYVHEYQITEYGIRAIPEVDYANTRR